MLTAASSDSFVWFSIPCWILTTPASKCGYCRMLEVRKIYFCPNLHWYRSDDGLCISSLTSSTKTSRSSHLSDNRWYLLLNDFFTIPMVRSSFVYLITLPWNRVTSSISVSPSRESCVSSSFSLIVRKRRRIYSLPDHRVRLCMIGFKSVMLRSTAAFFRAFADLIVSWTVDTVVATSFFRVRHMINFDAQLICVVAHNRLAC